jgi:hypothetical protein
MKQCTAAANLYHASTASQQQSGDVTQGRQPVAGRQSILGTWLGDQYSSEPHARSCAHTQLVEEREREREKVVDKCAQYVACGGIASVMTAA